MCKTNIFRHLDGGTSATFDEQFQFQVSDTGYHDGTCKLCVKVLNAAEDGTVKSEVGYGDVFLLAILPDLDREMDVVIELGPQGAVKMHCRIINIETLNRPPIVDTSAIIPARIDQCAGARLRLTLESIQCSDLQNLGSTLPPDPQDPQLEIRIRRFSSTDVVFKTMR